MNKKLMMIKNKICQKIYLIFLFLVITSCSWIYPNYARPQVKTNQEWSTTSNTTLSSIGVSDVLWWKEFNDSDLNLFVESALLNNNSIKKATANIASAQGQLKAIQLSFIPSISTYAGYSTNPALGIPGGFYGIWPGYFSLNIFATLAKEKSAEINLEAQKYILQSTKLVLIAEVVSSYIALLADTREDALVNNLIINMKIALAIEDASFKNGISNKYNYDEALANLKKVEADRNIVTANIIKSRNALCYLLNQVPHNITLKNNFNNLTIKSTNPNILPSTVLDNRPDIHFAEEKYKLAVQNTSLPYTSLLPNITLDQFMGGFNSFTNNNPTGGTASITDSYAYSTLNPSIFGQIDQLDADKKAALYSYIDSINKVLKDVDNSLTDFNTAVKSHQDIKERYAASYDKYQLKNQLYKNDIISKLDLIKEQILLDQVAIELNHAKLIHAYTLVRVYEELGGGYNVIHK